MSLEKEKMPGNEEIVLDRKRWVQTLGEGVGKLPPGDYQYVYKNGALVPFKLPEGKRLHEVADRVLEVRRRDGYAQIADARVIGHLTTDNTSMSMEYGEDGQLSVACFENGYQSDPAMSVVFKPDGKEMVSRADVTIQLMRGIASLPLEYRGNCQRLEFLGVKRWNKQQEALVFEDNQFPDIDVFEFVVNEFFDQRYGNASKPKVPKLRFDPRKYSYAGKETYAFLQWDGKTRPEIGEGKVVKGVVTEGMMREKPYGVQVEILSVEEKGMWQQATKSGIFTEIEAKVLVNDGKGVQIYDKRLEVNSRLEDVRQCPELVVAAAFAAVHRESAKK